MELCSEEIHRCWASRLLGFATLLLSVFSTVAKSSGAHGSGVTDSGAHVPLQGIRGGSVLIHVIKKQEAEPEEVSWGFGYKSSYRVLLQIRRGADTLTWVNLQDKYQRRVHVLNVTSLRIENLTSEDSGQYQARVRFPGGFELTQVFLLTVYEPAPLPHILLESPSITPGWCNVTLECRAPGNREDLTVAWESEGLPRELEWSGTPGAARNSWSLHVNLSLSQPSAILTCVVSNQVDQKTATLDLGEVCFPGSSITPVGGILGAVMVMLLILPGGLYAWKTREKKERMETGRGTGLQDDARNHGCGVRCAGPSQPESREDAPKGISEQHLKETGLLTTIYSEVRKPRRP